MVKSIETGAGPVCNDVLLYGPRCGQDAATGPNWCAPMFIVHGEQAVFSVRLVEDRQNLTFFSE